MILKPHLLQAVAILSIPALSIFSYCVGKESGLKTSIQPITREEIVATCVMNEYNLAFNIGAESGAGTVMVLLAAEGHVKMTEPEISGIIRRAIGLLTRPGTNRNTNWIGVHLKDSPPHTSREYLKH